WRHLPPHAKPQAPALLPAAPDRSAGCRKAELRAGARKRPRAARCVPEAGRYEVLPRDRPKSRSPEGFATRQRAVRFIICSRSENESIGLRRESSRKRVGTLGKQRRSIGRLSLRVRRIGAGRYGCGASGKIE